MLTIDIWFENVVSRMTSIFIQSQCNIKGQPANMKLSAKVLFLLRDYVKR